MSSHRSVVRRASSLTALLVAVVMVAGACAPQPPNPSGPSPSDEFCEFFDEVAEAPPTVDSAVLVKEDVVALAEDAIRIGEDCTDSGARVELFDAVVAEGEEIPLEQGVEEPEVIAAVTGPEIGAGETVLENLQLTSLSARIDANGITIRGNVAIRLSGVTSTIGFSGTLRDLDNWSINLASSGLTIPGISATPVTFSGTLTVRNGSPSLAMSARATAATIGDVTINQAEIDLIASQTDGVSAYVSGDIKVGPSTANGTVEVTFDRTGRLVTAHADLSAHLVGTQADGKPIDLTGTVSLVGNAEETAISFSGHGVVGDLIVNEANGSLTLATNRATFTGKLDVQQGVNSVRFNASLVWDGKTAHAPVLALEGEGEFSGTLDDGTKFAVAGELNAEIIGGQLRSVVRGSFTIGTLRANGAAVVETNGATTTLEVDAELVDAGFDARLEGAVQITDGRAELVHLDAAVQGQIQMGDLTLTGAALQVRSTYGNPLDVRFTGGLKIGNKADVTGEVVASIGPNGSLLSLVGNVNGSLALDSWAVVNFSGGVVATMDQVTLSGSGGVVLNNFPAGLTISGTLTSSLNEPTWSLSGTGRFRIASIDVASARVNLSQTAGMRATRVGFYFSIIGIPTYFEGNFYMQPSGGCEKVDITGGSLIAKLALVVVLPGAIGCPVNI